MSLFGRIIVIIFGLLVAIIVAGITLAIGIVLPEWATMDSDPIERVIFFFAAFFATSYVGAVAIFPAALVIVILEAARMRSFLYYGIGGALVALASYYGSFNNLKDLINELNNAFPNYPSCTVGTFATTYLCPVCP